jgi:release factor glutamine methyltransferase
MVIGEILKKSVKILDEAGFEDPFNEAVTLMAAALGRTKSYIYTHKDEKPDNGDTAVLFEYVGKRIRRMPVSYITGKAWFMSLEFIVTPEVLIPRPETEAIVEKAVATAKDSPKNEISVLDICAGSGCIGISVAYHYERITAVLADKMPGCINVEKANITKHGLEERVSTIQSDMFENLKGQKFDLILCNPPYVKQKDIDSLEDDVKLYEPTGALDGGEDGLDFYRILSKQAPGHLLEGGYLVLELGIGQEDDVLHLVEREGLEVVSVEDDISGIPRILVARTH